VHPQTLSGFGVADPERVTIPSEHLELEPDEAARRVIEEDSEIPESCVVRFDSGCCRKSYPKIEEPDLKDISRN
jgi:hypothetical protein